ncbi:MAG TPA: hypothetical protein VMU07_03105 [Candidatus Paceibacterota bacterium]|nr:hypothetical protein [Candidatus Paceibacterota bacterium]
MAATVSFAFFVLCPAVHADAPATATAMFFNQLDDSSNSVGSWYNDNWYQLGRGFAGTINAITLEGMVDADMFSASEIYLKEFEDQNYTRLVTTYTISDNAPFDHDGFKKITFDHLSIPINPSHYYRLDTFQNRQNTSVILKGTPGLGTAMRDWFVYGTGKVESTYPFYPYVIVTGQFLEPLVIVPGVMGSELSASGTDLSAGKQYWPDVTDMVNSDDDAYLNALALDANGMQVAGKEMAASDIVREATGTYNRLVVPIPIDEKIYGDLIAQFVNDGYHEGENLFVAPYDWRLDLASSAQAVGGVIQNAVAHSPDGKVNIIAHSMGGLAIKQYLAGVADASFIHKLILSGVPQLGSPMIFKTLEYGDNLGFSVGPFDILNPTEVKSIAQNMPGIYELLPSRRFVSVDGGYVSRDSHDANGNVSTQALGFDDTNAFLLANPGDSRNASLLSRADQFHAGLDAQPIVGSTGAAAAGTEIINVVGCENPTPSRYDVHDDGSIDVDWANGDGSVPVDSAMNLANGYENYFVLNSENGVDHEGLVRDSPMLAFLQGAIDGTLPSLALQSLGMSTATEDCLAGRGADRPATFAVSASGSSTIDVYDAAGNHVGVNAAGDVDLQIPGSSYDTIGGTTVVTLRAPSTTAASGAYSVTVKKSKTASSKTKVSVKAYDSAVNVVTTTVFSDVPLDAPSSSATLTIRATSTPILTVDEDAAGAAATGTVIAPDGALSSAELPLTAACVQIKT